jgi:hypothetical protein
MPNKEAIKREALRGHKLLAEYARRAGAAEDAWKRTGAEMFPSLDPSSRKWVSPLDGRSPDWEWSGKRKG